MSHAASLTTGRAQSPAAFLSWAFVGIYTLLAGVTIALEKAQVGGSSLVDLWVLVAALAYAVVGALIVSRHPRHVIGWMFSVVALGFGVAFFSSVYAVQALVVVPGTLPFGQAAAWFGLWTELPSIAVLGLFLPLLFPDGHLPSRRWRPAAFGSAAVFAFSTLSTMLAPATYASMGYPSIRNPFGLDQFKDIFQVLDAVLDPLLYLIVFVSGAALLARLRGSDLVRRQQVKWFAYAAALVLASFVVNALAKVVTLLVLATVFTPVKNTLQERVDRRIKPPSRHGAHRVGMDELVMLAELHRSGVLTDDEFAAKKKQILGI